LPITDHCLFFVHVLFVNFLFGSVRRLTTQHALLIGNLQLHNSH